MGYDIMGTGLGGYHIEVSILKASILLGIGLTLHNDNSIGFLEFVMNVIKFKPN